MSSSSPERTGLRERKKAKTRQRIQDEALRLIAAQGYEATTVEQIADAAEVSPSTFFRYYPTKEDVIIQDRWDPSFLELFTDPDDNRSPLQAMLDTWRKQIREMSPTDVAQSKERTQLMLSVPALRARAIDYAAEMLDVLGRNLASKVGRAPDDLEIRAFCGAVVGAMVAVAFEWTKQESGPDRLADMLEQTLHFLEGGLRLP